ncbi:hypothetical protein AS026_37465 [Rhizobium altiplani]|uniref:Uncharacterized protein n=2 Tax=Rhizobium altiplani TaxID=1864509 RepID=A0A109JV80_9HYPH|nr:hypothetical protein AS026_37465 [Rhizobium altiplani]
MRSPNRKEAINKYIELFQAAFDELHEAVVANAKAATHISRHHDYPNMSRLDTGFPAFGQFGFYNEATPRDYLSLVRPNRILGLLAGYQRPEVGFPKGEKLAAFLRGDNLGKRLDLWRYDGEPSDGPIDILVGGCVERYIHLYGVDAAIDAKRRDKVIFPVMFGTISKTLNVSLVVPIAMTHFDVDRFRLSETTYITRIPRKMQLARARMSTMGTGAVSSVVGAATHAFVSRQWTVGETNNIHEVRNSLSWLAPDAMNAIDSFFGALRVATGVRTGFAQALWVPNGWALDYFCDLTPVYGATLRQYPNEFDNYGWLEQRTPITRGQLEDVRRIYGRIVESKSEAVRLALKRLNGCLTRTDAADAILDGTIGLELLLGDDQNQSLSYKLRLRAGVLSRLSGDTTRDAAKTAAQVKQLYAARSAIVHGIRRKETKKTSEPADTRYEKERLLASDLLRFILDVLLTHPEYQTPGKIDEDLLLGGAGIEKMGPGPRRSRTKSL